MPYLIPSGGGGGAANFTELNDAPNNYAGAGGKKVVVKTSVDGVEFEADSLLTLSDTPSVYTGASLYGLRVNTSENAIEFFDETLLSLSDTPANYTGASGYYVKVNATGTGIEFASLVVDPVLAEIGFIDSPYGASAADIILVGATSGNVVINMPLAPTTSSPIKIKRTDNSANTVWVSGNGNNIDGATGYNLISLESISLVPDSSNDWWIL